MLQAQKALETGVPHLIKRRTTIDYRSMRPRASNRTAEVAARLKQQPELEYLFKAMALRLANYPQRDRKNLDATLLDQLPKLRDHRVRLSS